MILYHSLNFSTVACSISDTNLQCHDTYHSGTVDFDELMTYIEEMLAELNSGDDIAEVFNMIDVDNSGEVYCYFPFS